MTKIPTVPSPIWGSMVTDEEISKQFTLCVHCGPDKTPAKIVFISGTSYCPEHARQVLAK